MRFIGVPVVGIVGAIAFGLCGMLPFKDSTVPANSTSQLIISQKPVIPSVDSLNLFDRTLSTQSGLADSTVDDGVAVNSSAESNLREKATRLNRGTEFLQGISAYTVQFQKQEVVKGVLHDEQTIAIKCRRKPFSLYLNWVGGDAGREVIYVDGQNNGKMIAHDGGWKARIPAFTLAIDGTLAMRDTRYPATTAGFQGLIDIMAGIHQVDLDTSNFATCEMSTCQNCEGRLCDCFTTTYKSAAESPVYRKSITLIDHEWNLPLQTQHFEWPKTGTSLNDHELDQATLIESYSFTEIQLDCNLSDHDFDRKNPEYRFR